MIHEAFPTLTETASGSHPCCVTPKRRDFIRAAVLSSCLPLIRPLGSLAGTVDDRTGWYREAKFGMFMHWGPYALASVEASWPIMTPKAGGISEAEYRELPKRFNPTKFDPYSFVDLARAAGQQHLVFTTKHHDGAVESLAHAGHRQRG